MEQDNDNKSVKNMMSELYRDAYLNSYPLQNNTPTNSLSAH